METNNVFRHGDLVINKINNTDTKLKKTKLAVLAEGEFTGHAHRLTALDTGTKIEFDKALDKATFRVEGGRAILRHEEHNEIVFEPGIYEVLIKREYD